MKIGCCINMLATESDIVGKNFIPKVAQVGFDYVEIPLAETTSLNDDEFEALKKLVEDSGIPCEVCNNFFPKTLRLTGPDVDDEAVSAYINKSLGRAAELGAKVVVFGSGPAKTIPEGFPMEDGYQQIQDLAIEISAIADSHGITVVLEPLRNQECNILNSFKEGVELAKTIERDSIMVLVDYFHFAQNSESVDALLSDGYEWLEHVHFANNAGGRIFPATLDEDNYATFIDALKTIGYDNRVSVEAFTDDFDKAAPVALEFCRNNF